MRRAVMYAAAITLLLSGLATAATEASANARQQERRPKVTRCADHHPWVRVGQRQGLIWCIAHAFDSPGTPRYAIAIARCESGDDFQDLYGGDGHIGTFQHITSSWPARWRLWGQRLGVSSSGTNILSQAVVSVRMAKAIGGWGASGGWSCA